MKPKKNKITFTRFVIIFSIATALILFPYKYSIKHQIGNRQIVDFKYKFNYAYLETNGKTERIEIVSWYDWDDSNAIQFTDKSGKVYYTQLSRVILSNK